MKVAAVDVALCSFPLPALIRLGPVEYRTRDYVALRLRTEDEGLVGFAAGYTRGTPLFEGARMLAPSVIGADALERSATMAELVAARRPGQAALVRPLSLFEMALADLAAKCAGQPLHSLLGGHRRELPVMAVCGYFIDDRGDEAILEDLERLEAEGFGQLKLMLGMRPIPWMTSFLGQAKERLKAETILGVDLHYSVASVEEGLRLLRALEDVDLGFVEDPFDPPRWRQLKALAAQSEMPLAVGEDVVSPHQYRDLLESAAILRVDPSSCGGFAAAISGIDLAAAAGVPVIPHGLPGACAQLAGAFSGVSAIEVTPPEIAQDGFDSLIELPYELRDGIAHLDDAPGNGLRLDWEGVVAAATTAWSACDVG
jgi:L-alanine-DL-glutamate epimerase-like enolase superfamily enzyme